MKLFTRVTRITWVNVALDATRRQSAAVELLQIQPVKLDQIHFKHNPLSWVKLISNTTRKAGFK